MDLTNEKVIRGMEGEGRSCCGFDFRRNDEQESSVNESDVDAKLAKELNELTFEERATIFDEIHGVAQVHEETPEFLQACMERLDRALGDLPRTRRHAWDRALFLRPSLGTDIKFKLMFLRADVYDASKAARRLAKYFEDKLKLFGEEKLVKKITLDDLSEDDLNLLRTGFFMLLPHKDRAGRPIWFGDVSKYKFEDEMLRCCWYQIMTSIEDETAQLKGTAFVVYSHGRKFNSSVESVTLSKFMNGGLVLVNLPARVTSFHFCYNNPAMEYFLNFFRLGLGKELRLRCRVHFGSSIEAQYSLMTFGISCPFIIDKEGVGEDMQIELQKQYIDRRFAHDRHEEQLEKERALESGIILYPNQKDILVGRGGPYQNFSGNRSMMALINASCVHQKKEGKKERDMEKGSFCMGFVRLLEENGSRFLEKLPSGIGWRIVDDRVAQQKVASCFRSQAAKVQSSDTSIVGNKSALDDSTVGPSGGAKRLRYDPSVN